MSASARFRIAVCRGPECAGQRAGNAVHERLARLIDEQGLHDRVILERRVCFGRCTLGPNVHVRELVPPVVAGAPATAGGDFAAPGQRARPRSALYNGVGEDDVYEIIESHVLGSEVVHRLIRRPAPAPGQVPGQVPDLAPGQAPAQGQDAAVGRDPRLATAARLPHASSDTETATPNAKKPDAGD